jgi:dimethylamine monooxygenase subunit A
MSGIKYFPFSGEPYKPQMGLKALDPSQWIERCENLLPQLRLKKEILASQRAVAFHSSPGSEEACLELEELLREHLCRHDPAVYRQNGNIFSVAGFQDFSCPPSSDPLGQLAQYVQEDFCLLSPSAPVRFEAGAVCFLSRWKVSEKAGKQNEAVHSPVPDFSLIARQSTHFLESLQPGRLMARFNWTVQDGNELFLPEIAPQKMPYTPENVLENSWLRVERQTLRRLPKTRFVVFTIRTFHYAMTEVARDPLRRAVASSTISGLSREMASYKGMRYFWEEMKIALARPADKIFTSSPTQESFASPAQG